MLFISEDSLLNSKLFIVEDTKFIFDIHITYLVSEKWKLEREHLCFYNLLRWFRCGHKTLTGFELFNFVARQSFLWTPNSSQWLISGSHDGWCVFAQDSKLHRCVEEVVRDLWNRRGPFFKESSIELAIWEGFDLSTVRCHLFSPSSSVSRLFPKPGMTW